jgi:hypothetical protein
MNTKGLMIAAGGYIGFAVFIMIIPMFSSDYQFSPDVFFSSLLPIIILGGYISTSMAFAELNSPQKSYLYLTLPASTLEKLAVAWFSNSIVYLVFSVIVLFIINLLLFIIDKICFSSGVVFVNLFDKDVLMLYANYLVTQTVFLLGAIYFRKLNFLKTVLVLIIVVFAIALYCGLLIGLANLLNGGHIQGKLNHFHIGNKDVIIQTISSIAKVLYWGFTAPFFLIVSYLSLKERQV